MQTQEFNDLLSLKIDLMTEGMRVSPEVWDYVGQTYGSEAVTTGDYATTGGVILRLASDVYVNAPFQGSNPNFVNITRRRLAVDESGLILRGKGIEHPVEFVPVASYHDLPSSHGGLQRDYAVTHGDRVRLSPVVGCSIACDFCDIPDVTPEYGGVKPPPAFVEATQLALDDAVQPAEHILISGGTPRKVDYQAELDVYAAVAEAFPTVPLDIMMVPMPGLIEPANLKAMGVDTLCLNLELSNADIAAQHMNNKLKASRRFYYERIAEAVEVFGLGSVRSLLLVGLEPLEDTLSGVRALAELGCDPVLSPFRPDPNTPLKDTPPASKTLLHEVYKRSREIVDQYPGVLLGPRCITCQHNTLTVPDGEGYGYGKAVARK
jgi:hypothetical protein